MKVRCNPSLAITVAVAALGLAACSPQQASQAHAATPQTNAELSKPQTACWLLPANLVSKVLGEPLTAVAELGAMKYGSTSCNYYAPGAQPDEDAPRLTVTLDWNGYNMVAMQIPHAGPVTAAAPYADIGDGALLDRGVLFVRTGEHSVAMDLRGDGDLHGIAAQLIAAAKPKLAK